MKLDKSTLEEGKEYWVTFVNVNKKGDGFLRNTKPFPAILLKKTDNWRNDKWDLSNWKKKYKYADEMICYYGFVCANSEDAIKQYNQEIEKSSKSILSKADYVSKRMLENLITDGE